MICAVKIKFDAADARSGALKVSCISSYNAAASIDFALMGQILPPRNKHKTYRAEHAGLL